MTKSPIPAQEDGGATILEIGQQPGAWREIAAGTDARSTDFLRDVIAHAGPPSHPDRGRQFGVRR